MAGMTPQQHVQKAFEWMDRKWAQYGRQLSEGRQLTTFSEFLRSDIIEDKHRYTLGVLHNASKPAQEDQLQNLRQTEVREVALKGMGETLHANRFNTSYKYTPTNMQEIELAAEGYGLDKFGNKKELPSTSMAGAIKEGRLKTPEPEPAKNPVNILFGTPAKTPDNKITQIAEEAYGLIKSYKDRGLSNQEMYKSFEAEAKSIGDDLRSGRAQITPEIVGSLRQTELGMYLIKSGHAHDPDSMRNHHEVKKIMRGEIPELRNDKSKSGILEARLEQPAAAASAVTSAYQPTL